jgi:hypothetical protein
MNRIIRQLVILIFIVVSSLCWYGLYYFLDPGQVTNDKTRYILLAFSTGVIMFIPIEKYIFKKKDR